MSIVTLITDFGTRDGYVGEMKGVILERCPGATLVDVTHDIEPGDVEGAAWVLGRVWDRYPAGTVHLAVVDPGVGGERRAVALHSAGRWFVGPDNGLTARVGDGAPETLRVLDPEALGLPAPGATFHGRDLFAPAAAWVAGGGDPAALGAALDPADLVRLDLPEPERAGAWVRGRVAHVDRFGNLITDIPADWVGEGAIVEIAGVEVSGLRTHYGAAEPGELLALIGSGGTLEVSVRGGSAAADLSARRSDPVSVRTRGG